ARVGDAEPVEPARDIEPAEDRGAQERPGGHPEERQSADDPEGPWPVVALEQVRRGRSPDRDEDAATDPLDDPARDQLIEVLAAAGDERADDEHDERTEEQPARAPHNRQATGEGHRDDVRQEIAIDDPRSEE